MTLLDGILSFLSIFTMPWFFAVVAALLLIAAFALFILLGPASGDLETYSKGWQFPLIAWCILLVLVVVGVGMIIWAGSSAAPFEWVAR